MQAAMGTAFQRCFYIEARDEHLRVYVSRGVPVFLRRSLAQMSMWGGVDYAGSHALGFDVHEAQRTAVLDWMSAVGYTHVPQSKASAFTMEKLP